MTRRSYIRGLYSTRQTTNNLFTSHGQSHLIIKQIGLQRFSNLPSQRELHNTCRRLRAENNSFNSSAVASGPAILMYLRARITVSVAVCTVQNRLQSGLPAGHSSARPIARSPGLLYTKYEDRYARQNLANVSAALTR